MFAAIQSDFASALLDPERAVPRTVTSHTLRHPDRRFAVYRNNVAASLINAIRTKFPATERIVGDEFFVAVTRLYVLAHPPRSKILHVYGDDFADFIAAFAPTAELPYLADVARLEAARTRAYHAADATPLNGTAFATIDPEQIATMQVTLHPSLQVVRSRHPVVTIWSMNAGETEIGPVDDTRGEDALVVRPVSDVTVRALPPGGAVFLNALSSGFSLGDAVARAMAADNGFDITTNLAGLIGSGAIVDYIVAEGQMP